jgi:PKD repeat protein
MDTCVLWFIREVARLLDTSPVCARDTVIFTDLSYSPPPFEYLKKKIICGHPGGHNDTSAMPKFVYSGGGKYVVALTVVNEKDCDSSMLL